MEAVFPLYDQETMHQPGTENGGDKFKILWTRETSSSKQTQFEIRHFLDYIRTGEKTLTDGRTALQSLRVIWKMYDAEKFGVMADLRGLGIEE